MQCSEDDKSKLRVIVGHKATGPEVDKIGIIVRIAGLPKIDEKLMIDNTAFYLGTS